MTRFTPAKKAFLVAISLYALLSVLGYAWYTSNPTPTESVKLTTVAVTLSMFQAPTPTLEPTPKVIKETLQPEPIKPIEQQTKPTPKPQPKITPTKISPPKKIDIKQNEPPKKTFEKPKETTPSKPTVTPITAPLKTSTSQRDTKPTPDQVIEQPTKEITTQPIISPEQSAHAEQSYLNELNSLIAQHAYNSYPRRAKRRNWQGEVSIQFTLLPNGRITHLSIIESSGRKLLDDAALHIFQVKMNQQFKPFPKEIVRTQWRIEIPVSYHLN